MSYFYAYTNPNPSSLSDPQNWGHWENPADWPRTYLYVSAHQGAQGIHPPAPVYQSNQTSQSAMYYFAGSSTAPAGYYVNGLYYGSSPPSASTGWPYTSASTAAAYACYTLPTATSTSSPYSFYPYTHSPYYAAATHPFHFPAMTNPWSTATASASQAAAAVAANAALAQMPNAPAYFVGATAADMQAQNAILFANLQAAQSSQQPSQLAPYKPGTTPQFWCKETDGSWTLREYSDALKSDFPAGHWERHATSGYYYYVRHPSS